MHDRHRVAFVLLAALAVAGSARPRADAPPSAALLFGDPLDVNRASAADLAALPGIGPTRARRIADYRAHHGAFRSLADLDAIPGIGPHTLARLAPVVTFGK